MTIFLFGCWRNGAFLIFYIFLQTHHKILSVYYLHTTAAEITRHSQDVCLFVSPPPVSVSHKGCSFDPVHRGGPIKKCPRANHHPRVTFAVWDLSCHDTKRYISILHICQKKSAGEQMFPWAPVLLNVFDTWDKMTDLLKGCWQTWAVSRIVNCVLRFFFYRGITSQLRQQC